MDFYVLLNHQCINLLVKSKLTPSLSLFARKFSSYSMHLNTVCGFLILIMCFVNQAAVSEKCFPLDCVLFGWRLHFHVSNNKSKPRATP